MRHLQICHTSFNADKYSNCEKGMTLKKLASPL